MGKKRAKQMDQMDQDRQIDDLGIECDKKPYITNNMGMSWDLMGRFYGMYDQENVIVGLVGSENEGFT